MFYTNTNNINILDVVGVVLLFQADSQLVSLYAGS